MNRIFCTFEKGRRFSAAFSMLGVVLLLASCQTRLDPDDLDDGALVFEASAEFEAEEITRSDGDDGAMTRTVYTGKDESGATMGSRSSYERIEWLSTDQISVLCPQAGRDKTAKFVVRPGSYSGNKHNATIDPIDHKLYWNAAKNLDHYFFGLYPAPGMTGAPSATAITQASSTSATVTGTIPATQEYTLSGSELKPKMECAYMYAVSKVNSGSTGGNGVPVSLSFKPMVTTLRFTLKTKSDMAGKKLTKIELISTNSDSFLAGTFTGTLTGSGLTPLTTSNISGGSGSRTITINITGGYTLSTSTPLMFTVLTLPMTQTLMKLKLTFDDNATRTVELKSSASTYITVAACKKAYINDLNLPWKYGFTVTPDDVAQLTSTEQNASYTVTSYKYISESGTKVATPWTVSSYAVNGAWTDSRPAALTTSTSTSGTGSSSGETATAAFAANNTNVNRSWSGPTTPQFNNATYETAINLSWLTPDGKHSGTMSTANCYVVGSPGHYVINNIFGNALKNGATNASAYNTGNTHSNMLQQLVRGDGNAIVDPYLASNSMDWTRPYEAIVCWKDCTTSIEIENYSQWGIWLNINDLEEGNAVIALRYTDGNKEVIWSWHLWFMEPSKFKTKTIGDRQVMTMNLGWADAASVAPPREIQIEVKQDETGETDIVKFYQQSNKPLGGNVYYQWGRKDPMLGYNEDGNRKTQYYPNTEVMWQATTQTINESQRPVYVGIQYPNHFLKHYSNGRWYQRDEGFGNLWNAQAVVDADNPVIKTVYDPCPPGYKMPNKDFFKNLRQYGELPASYGRAFKTSSSDTEGIYFPGNGMLDKETGNLDNDGMAAIWTAGRYPGDSDRPDQGTYLQLNQGFGKGWGYTEHYIGDGFGLSVRCIVE